MTRDVLFAPYPYPRRKISHREYRFEPHFVLLNIQAPLFQLLARSKNGNRFSPLPVGNKSNKGKDLWERVVIIEYFLLEIPRSEPGCGQSEKLPMAKTVMDFNQRTPGDNETKLAQPLLRFLHESQISESKLPSHR